MSFPLDREPTALQEAVSDLNKLLRANREKLDRRRYEAFVSIGICRFTGEWRVLLDDAEDDPRKEAA